MTNEQDLLPFSSAAGSGAQWRDRVSALLDQVALSKRPCRACGRVVWFTRNKSGRVGVWDSDGQSHFATCPAADKFRKGGPHAA